MLCTIFCYWFLLLSWRPDSEKETCYNQIKIRRFLIECHQEHYKHNYNESHISFVCDRTLNSMSSQFIHTCLIIKISLGRLFFFNNFTSRCHHNVLFQAYFLYNFLCTLFDVMVCQKGLVDEKWGKYIQMNYILFLSDSQIHCDL